VLFCSFSALSSINHCGFLIENHEGYTLRVLSIITGWVGVSFLCYSPHVTRFVTCLGISHGSLCVCTVGLRRFHHWRELALSFLVLVIEKTLNSTGLRVDREDWSGPSGLLLGYCWMVVCFQQNWVQTCPVGLMTIVLVWYVVTTCVSKINNVALLIGQSRYTIALLVFDNPVLFI